MFQYRSFFQALVEDDVIETFFSAQPMSSHRSDISSNTKAGQDSSGNNEPTDESHS